MGSINNSFFAIPFWFILHFPFNPPDEELLTDYLEKKNRGKDSEKINIIPEITLCNHEPREIPAYVCKWAKSLGKEWFTEGNNRRNMWYFFGRPDLKYRNSKRSNRTTGEGKWKITGNEREIKTPGSNTVIGRRRILTFDERAEVKAKKTNWVIHEYYLTQAHSNDQIGDFVICCLKKNSDMSDHHDKEDSPICSEAETGRGTVENQAAETGIPNKDEVHDNDFIELDDLLHLDDLVSLDDLLSLDEAETGSGGSPTVENQAADTGIPNKDECSGSPTDSCLAEKNDPSNSVEGQPDGCISLEMIDKQYESGTLYSIVYPRQPHPLPQLHQPSQMYQPQVHSPSTVQSPTSTKLGNDSHTNNVNYGKCHKRKVTFEDNTSYPPEKKNIPTNYHDEVLGNAESCYENQAANDWIPEGYPQPGTNLGSLPIQQQDSDYALPSINREPRDVSHDNDFIEWDDLLPPFGDVESSLAKFS